MQGPATILDATQTIVVLPNATALILQDHVVIDVGLGSVKKIRADLIDPVQLSGMFCLSLSGWR
jgi:5-oxoprolinase (ATP-hydrolysing)